MKYDKFYWLNEDSRTFLSRGYLKEGEVAEDRLREISEASESILGEEGFADKFYDYLSRGFYSLSTPVLCNFGKPNNTGVSCFSSYIPDSTDEILRKVGEVGIMSKWGGGTSGYFGDVRPRGSKIVTGGGETDGPIRFMEIFDKVTDVISQSSSRRGSFAAYLPVEHPDIQEFLQIRSDGHPIQRMSIGVTITDDWMESMIAGDKQKRSIWGKIIQKKYETGYPYIVYVDTANKNAPQWYRDQGRKIKNSNLCSEIFLPTNEKESFVCVLSCLNLLHWHEIQKTDAPETLLKFLWTVNEEFVRKTKDIPFMEDSRRFAEKHRAIGLGVLGWHSLLQRERIPFESMDAKFLNNKIFKEIKSRMDSTNKELVKLIGECEVTKGYGVALSTTMSLPPTTSSSFILGQVSQSIEPINSNYFVKRLAKGNFTYKNPELIELLNEKNKNDEITWKSILEKGGSVQHLDFLSENEKNVFKTFGEISQKEVIIQAAQRQPYIDQGQSLNIMVGPKIPAKEVSELMIEAWRLGIKSLYYQRGSNPSQDLARSLNQCVSCEG
jgi:ribonucleoside-diphosphate reductase alpha chain